MSSGVQFDEDALKYSRPRPAVGGVSGGYSPMSQFAGPSGNEPRMVQWLMKKGIVKSPNAGQFILVGIVIVNIIIMFIVIKYFL